MNSSIKHCLAFAVTMLCISIAGCSTGAVSLDGTTNVQFVKQDDGGYQVSGYLSASDAKAFTQAPKKAVEGGEAGLLKPAGFLGIGDCTDYCVLCIGGQKNGHQEGICTAPFLGIGPWFRAAAICGTDPGTGFNITERTC